MQWLSIHECHYVDDFILVGNDIHAITNTKKALEQDFSIKELGYLKYFLGFEISWSS